MAHIIRYIKNEIDSMKAAFYLLLIFVIPTASATESNAVKITQQSINTYISSVNDCFEKKSVECLSEKLADDVKMHIESSSGAKVSTSELTKKEYIEGMANAWKSIPGYSYKQTAVKVVTITPLNATYIESVVEVVPTAQATYEVVSESEVFVELVNSQIVTKKIIAKSILKTL
ncbi:hypothetical protein [Cellvibrio sp.]